MLSLAEMVSMFVLIVIIGEPEADCGLPSEGVLRLADSTTGSQNSPLQDTRSS